MTDANEGGGSPADAGHWVTAFYRDADLVDIDRLAAWFADDIDLRFANNPPIRDKQTAVSVMSEFYASIAGMKHVRENLFLDGASACLQGKVVYTTHDGREVTLPVSSYIRRNQDGVLDRLWIYIDMAPLYADGEGA